MANERKRDQPRLEVYLQRSVLVQEDGGTRQFDEGSPTTVAKQRLEKIKAELSKGFLTDVITACKQPGFTVDSIDAKHLNLLTGLVDSVTSEVGRAIVGLTVLQFSVKAITPEQSIRLHKAVSGKGVSRKRKRGQEPILGLRRAEKGSGADLGAESTPMPAPGGVQ